MGLAGAMEPVVVEPVVNREKLRELLALQAEYPTLDFKESCDLRRECLDRKRNQVELAKDVAAMSVRGGYLVIGVDKRGTPTGTMSQPQAGLFDEAKLRPMLLTWLPETLEIRSQDHEVDGKLVVLIYVAPNPAGCVFFRADGQYPHGKDTKTVFRQGEVFFREGTESRRMNQRGLERVIARRVHTERKRWERDHAAEYRRLADQLRSGTTGQRVASGPAAEFSLALEPEVLTAAAIELLRSDDDIPLRLLLNNAPARARQLLRAGDVPGLTGVVDRLGCLAASFLSINRQEWFERVVRTLTSIYCLPIEDLGVAHGHVSRDTAEFWLMMTERVLGLGSLAVRRENWQAVRTLAAYRVPLEGGIQRTWIQQTLVMATRAGLLETQQGT